LNNRDDLTFDELKSLSEELGHVENLNLSGGEPFIRREFDQIVRMFVQNNGVRQIYVPTSGYFTERTEKAVRGVLEERDVLLFACEISLDGTQAYHDRLRGDPKSFQKAMETYDMLADLQKEDPRLRIHAVSTAMNENLDEIHALTDYLHERCPAMDHHNLGVIRGDRRNPNLKAPAIAEYRALYEHVRARWQDREADRFGAIVEPMLQWAKLRTLAEQRQVIPCRAGVIAGVVYANGDVSVCELHEPLGNLRQASFHDIWNSPEAVKQRESIANKECWCTTEVFMWPSSVFQPVPLARALWGARLWQKGSPLRRSNDRPLV